MTNRSTKGCFVALCAILVSGCSLHQAKIGSVYCDVPRLSDGVFGELHVKRVHYKPQEGEGDRKLADGNTVAKTWESSLSEQMIDVYSDSRYFTGVVEDAENARAYLSVDISVKSVRTLIAPQPAIAILTFCLLPCILENEITVDAKLELSNGRTYSGVDGATLFSGFGGLAPMWTKSGNTWRSYESEEAAVSDLVKELLKSTLYQISVQAAGIPLYMREDCPEPVVGNSEKAPGN